MLNSPLTTNYLQLQTNPEHLLHLALQELTQQEICQLVLNHCHLCPLELLQSLQIQRVLAQAVAGRLTLFRDDLALPQAWDSTGGYA